MFGIDDAILGTVGAGLVNNLFAGSRQDDAQGFSAQQFASRYQTQVADMKAAGLNPMLAYTQGPGSAPTSSAASSSGMADVGQTINQSKIAAAQVANIQADTHNKEASADLIAGQAAQAWATADQARSNVGLIDANVKRIAEEIKNIPLEGDRLKKAAHLLVAQSSLADQQSQSETQRWGVLKATAAKLRTEGLILDKDYEAIIKTGSIGRLARELAPASDIASDWLNPAKWFTNKSHSTVESTVKRVK